MPMLRFLIAAPAAVAALSLAAGSGAQAQKTAPDLAKGRTAFQACAACHSDKPGVKRLGPSLAGTFGRPAAQVQGFAYSPALAKAKLRWDRKTLDQFIASPKSLVPGNRMTYPGVSDPAKRAAIIDYIESLR
jgi:cytochrome c